MLKKSFFTVALLLSLLLSSSAQCELDFSDALLFPFSGDIVNGVNGGVNDSASHQFDVIDEGATPLACGSSGGLNDITFDFNIIHAVDLYNIDGVIDAYAGSTHDITQSSTGLRGTIPLGNSGANESSAGDARGYRIKVSFGDHLNILAQEMAVNTNSINTAGNVFESTSIVFFDQNGINYGAAAYEGFYGNGSAGATIDSSCVAPAPGTPWAISGSGVYVAASTGTVDLSTPCVISGGTANPADDNNKTVQAVADAGLNNTDPIGGFIFTVYLEDVAASAAVGANTTTATSFSSTLKGVSIAALALPVELSDFQVQHRSDDKVSLSWQTLSESNNDFFGIERSQNGVTFHQIATVQGQNNSYTTQWYEYDDHTVEHGTYYYRLSQVDFDGQLTYSTVKSVVIEKKSSYAVYPTIVTQELNLTSSSQSRLSTFELVDVFGRLIKRGVLPNHEGLTLEVADLPEGSYFVRLSDGAQWEVFTILKKASHF